MSICLKRRTNTPLWKIPQLNAKFRQWLEDYTQRQQRADKAMACIEALRRKYPPRGRKFPRDEMNERK